MLRPSGDLDLAETHGDPGAHGGPGGGQPVAAGAAPHLLLQLQAGASGAGNGWGAYDVAQVAAGVAMQHMQTQSGGAFGPWLGASGLQLGGAFGGDVGLGGDPVPAGSRGRMLNSDQSEESQSEGEEEEVEEDEDEEEGRCGLGHGFGPWVGQEREGERSDGARVGGALDGCLAQAFCHSPFSLPLPTPPSPCRYPRPWQEGQAASKGTQTSQGVQKLALDGRKTRGAAPNARDGGTRGDPASR